MKLTAEDRIFLINNTSKDIARKMEAKTDKINRLIESLDYLGELYAIKLQQERSQASDT